MTNKEISAVLTALKSKPTQITLNEEEFALVYRYVLKDVDSAMVKPLMDWILLECKTWMPTTDAVHDFVQKISGTAPLTGAEVIREVRAKIQKYSIYGKRVLEMPTLRLEGAPPLSDEARAFVNARGGWKELCEETFTNEDFHWREAEKQAVAICEELKLESSRKLIASVQPDREAIAP